MHEAWEGSSEMRGSLISAVSPLTLLEGVRSHSYKSMICLGKHSFNCLHAELLHFQLTEVLTSRVSQRWHATVPA